MQDPLCWLGAAWERYNEFEEYRYYDKSISLPQFIAEWEGRLAAAVAAGCEYNDTVLAFKLLDRVQLAEEENRAVLAAAAARGGAHHEDMLALIKIQLAAQLRQEEEEEEAAMLKKEQREEEEGELGSKTTVVKDENGGVGVDSAAAGGSPQSLDTHHDHRE